MTTLPTGETLPDYDDEPAVNLDTLQAWLQQHRPHRWATCDGPAGYDRSIISDVVTALQAVSDATLVKNATYRAMRRDGADIERLAAALVRIGAQARIVEHNGNVVDAAVEGLDLLRKTALAVIGVDDE